MSLEEMQKESVFCTKNIYSGSSKMRVDAEISLPDYKEDAGRIIRADANCVISNKNTYIQGQFVFCDIEGILFSDVLYITEKRNENGALSGYKAETPFSHSVKIPINTDDPAKIDMLISFCEVNCENSNWKLIGPRKFTVKCDLDFDIIIKCNMLEEIFGEKKSAQIEKKMSEIKMGTIVQNIEKDFNIEEKITLPKEYLPVGEILSANGDVSVIKCDNKNGITSFSGIISLYCAYASQEGNEVASFYQPIEFSKEIESESFDEDAFTSLKAYIGDISANLASEDTDNKTIEFNIPFGTVCTVYKNESQKICTDMYSISNIAETEKKNYDFERILSLCRERKEIEYDIALKQNDIISAEKLSSEISIKNSYFENNEMVIEGRCFIHFAGIREEGALVGIDDSFDFKTSVELQKLGLSDSGDDIRVEIDCGIVSCEAGILKEDCKVKIDAVFDILMMKKERISAVSSFIPGEERRNNKGEIILYYPEADEKMWDICKKYGKSMDSIMKINEMKSENDMPIMLRIE